MYLSFALHGRVNDLVMQHAREDASVDDQREEPDGILTREGWNEVIRENRAGFSHVFEVHAEVTGHDGEGEGDDGDDAQREGPEVAFLVEGCLVAFFQAVGRAFELLQLFEPVQRACVRDNGSEITQRGVQQCVSET